MYCYKYTDLADNIVKYIGIVQVEGRTVSKRAKDHFYAPKDKEWFREKIWKIEYIYCKTRSDCEALENHCIALYGTYKYYNKAKANWGLCTFIGDIKWEGEFIYDATRNEETGKIKDEHLERLCKKSMYIFSAPRNICFFKTFKEEPIKIYKGLDEENLKYAKENNLLYLDNLQYQKLKYMLDKMKEKFGWGTMPNETEQLAREKSIMSEKDCYTYKMYNIMHQKEMNDAENYIREQPNINKMLRTIKEIENYVYICVYGDCICKKDLEITS